MFIFQRLEQPYIIAQESKIKGMKASNAIDQKLLGVRQIFYEAEAFGIKNEDAIKKARQYTDFVSQCVLGLKRQSLVSPKDKPSLRKLWEKVGRMLSERFSFSDNCIMCDAFGEKGVLNCYTSLSLSMDIFDGMGINAKAVALVGHSVLKVDAGSTPLYVQTTIWKKEKMKAAILDKSELVRKYPHIQMEYAPRQFPDPLFLSNIGVFLDLAGKAMDGMKYHSLAIEKDPKNLSLYLNRGANCTIRGDYKGAISDFSAAIRLEPGFEAPYTGRGVAYLFAGEYAKSLKDLDKAIEIKPTARAYQARAAVYEKTGEKKKSAEDARKARELGWGQ